MQRDEKVPPAINMPSMAKEDVWNERDSMRRGTRRAANAVISLLLVKTQGRNRMMPAAQAAILYCKRCYIYWFVWLLSCQSSRSGNFRIMYDGPQRHQSHWWRNCATTVNHCIGICQRSRAPWSALTEDKSTSKLCNNVNIRVFQH